TAHASALEGVQTKTRVWHFSSATPLHIRLNADASSRLHLENQSGSTEHASASPHAAGGGPRGLPAPRTRGNPNPVGEQGTFYVDPKGNVIPTPPGGRITGSPDGRFIQARDAAGNPTG